MKIDKILKEIGLSEKEQKAYRALIEVRESTASALAKKLGFSRELSYYILAALEEKGLVSRDPKRKVATYRPESPDRLIDLYRLRIKYLDDGLSLVQEEVKKMEALYKMAITGPSISYFEGIRGIKKMYESVFYGKKPKELLVFASSYDYLTLNNFLKDHIRKLTLHNIPQRLIVTEDMNMSDKIGGVKLKRDIKRVSREKLNMPAEVSITDTGVFLSSFKRNKVGVAIENKDLADSLRQIFNYIWEN